MTTSHVLVPIAPAPTIEQTVKHAIERLSTTEQSGDVLLSIVSTWPRERVAAAMERAEQTARDHAPASVTVERADLRGETYLSDPLNHAAVVATYYDRHGADLLVLDPNFSIDDTDRKLQTFESALSTIGIRYEHPPETDRRHVVTRSELWRFAIVFAVAFGFFLTVAGGRFVFAATVGAGSALAVAGILRNVVFEQTPAPLAAIGVVVRGIAYVPYLAWEILRANVIIAYVVLHPSLPIQTSIDRIETPLESGFSVTGFANSITLTPGTLTVDAARNDLWVHSMTEGTREDLLDGHRERALRYVFEGRSALEASTPLERSTVETVVDSGSESDREDDTVADRNDDRGEPQR